MRVSSPAYEEGGRFPTEHTCDGADTTPPWVVHDVPADAVTLAAVFDDPDAPAGTWVHWLAWNLPPDRSAWPAGTDGRGLGVVGANGGGRSDYGGPCPPGGTHRYVLTVYALDVELDLPEGSDRAAFDAAREGHVLAQGRLTATYAR